MKTLSINPRKLFLFDAFGATLTSFTTGTILVHFSEYVGVPKPILYILAAIALMFSIYSFLTYLFFGTNWRVFMKIIVFGNVSYCFATLVVLYISRATLKWPGILYFLFEILIVFTLSSVEWKIATSK